MIKMEPRPNPIAEAVKSFGSEKKLAAACGLSQAAINKAKRQFEKEGTVSPRMAVAVERATQGAVTKGALCPQYFGAAA